MGVYIPGMQMPGSCEDCVLSFIVAQTGFERYCPIGGDRDDPVSCDIQTKIGCPLVEVPTPHRRLIEEPETLCYAGLAKISTHDFRGEAEYFCKQVRAQRTVLEAEDE